MARSAGVEAAALEQIATFCASRVPSELGDKVRLELVARGSAVTIVERRPPWRPDLGSEWSSSDIARLSFDPHGRSWSLQWKDSSGRWHRYDETPASDDIAPLLAEIDADPTGIFWG